MTLAIVADRPIDPRPCRAPGADPAVWFPEGSQPHLVARAKALCATCPARAACLAAALARNEQFGIWGGLTAAERRPLPRQHPCRWCGGPAPTRLQYCGPAREPARL